MRTNIVTAAAFIAIGLAPAFAQAAEQGAGPLGVPIATERLADLRGGTDLTVNDMRLNGATAGNSATNVQTGTNTITDGALAHMSGIPVVIQNTGANVLIQNALILNVTMR
jgi:hypothetical protein